MPELHSPGLKSEVIEKKEKLLQSWSRRSVALCRLESAGLKSEGGLMCPLTLSSGLSPLDSSPLSALQRVG